MSVHEPNEVTNYNQYLVGGKEDMERKLTKTTLLVVGICLLISLVCNVPLGSAQNSWSDDFSDGNYTDWTVVEGTFNASNYILEASGDPGGIVDWHKIRHSSQVAYGNWSIDMYINGSEDTVFYISFIADSLFDWGPSLFVPRNGYALFFDTEGPTIMTLERWTDEDYSELDSWIPSAFHGWQNITITRDITGAFTVSVNGTSRISVTDNNHTTSSQFGWMSDPWSAIDNVIVNELPDISTNGTTPPIPGFPVIAIAAGISAALIIGVVYRRRKPKS
ncbi:MAG: hypothetical protein ACFFCB_08520 [Candidatus Odinarchaeota archaeon]